MRKLLTIIFLLASLNLSAVNYYVKVGGSDAANGLTDATAWATINKVNSSSFNPGDIISFKRGGTWSEVFDPPSSGTSANRITFNAYGTGADPIITARGSVAGWSSTGNWTNLGSNIWRLSVSYNERFRLWINGTEVQKRSSSAVTAALPWYFSGNLLYVFSTSNPASAFSSMELSGLRTYAMTLTVDYVTFINLDFRGGGGGGWATINISNADYVTFNDCQIGKDSGCFGINASDSDHGEIMNCTIDAGDSFFDLWQAENSEDGVHIKDNCDYWLIHDNLLQNWGHDCIRMSAYELGSTLNYNKVYYNEFTAPDVDYCRPIDVNARAGTSVGNEVYSNYMHDYPTGCQLNCEGLKFYNNLLINCVGTVWDGEQGNHIRIQEFEGFVPHDMQIYNNTIVNGVDGGIITIGWVGDSYLLDYGTIYGLRDNIIANNNLYNNATTSLYSILIDNYSRVSNNTWRNNNIYRSGYTGQVRYHGTTYTVAQFNALNGTNGDVIRYNITSDPFFVSSTDFHLQSSSALIGMGTTPISTYDYDGVAWKTPAAIGAYEYAVAGTVSPSVTTTVVTSITQTTASSGGNVTYDGGGTVTARGVCWSTAANPTTANFSTSNGTGTGAFTSSITGLTDGTTYYVRAYATNSAGTSYGAQYVFTTSATPDPPVIISKGLVKSGSVLIKYGNQLVIIE